MTKTVDLKTRKKDDKKMFFRHRKEHNIMYKMLMDLTDLNRVFADRLDVQQEASGIALLELKERIETLEMIINEEDK